MPCHRVSHDSHGDEESDDRSAGTSEAGTHKGAEQPHAQDRHNADRVEEISAVPATDAGHDEVVDVAQAEILVAVGPHRQSAAAVTVGWAPAGPLASPIGIG